MTCHGVGGPRLSPPEVIVAVKALACELPSATGVPLARWHCPDLARQAIQQGITASVSGTTIWRWLSADAIKPWRVRSWIFPRDPAFAAKAGRVLDLYARTLPRHPGSRVTVTIGDQEPVRDLRCAAPGLISRATSGGLKFGHGAS